MRQGCSDHLAIQQSCGKSFLTQIHFVSLPLFHSISCELRPTEKDWRGKWSTMRYKVALDEKVSEDKEGRVHVHMRKMAERERGKKQKALFFEFITKKMTDSPSSNAAHGRISCREDGHRPRERASERASVCM